MRRIIAIVGLGGCLGGLAERAAEEVDGVALEADMGLDRSGDADVRVAQQLLDDDEFDALFQEEDRG